MEETGILDGRYRITGRIGAGGMGDVYRAERIRLGDEVAIKFVRPNGGDDPAVRERFVSEGRMAAALRHPNVVSVLDVGADDARGPFLVMEYLNGPSLAQEIAVSGAFRVDRAGEILAGLASALDLAHSIGLVHRDLKPGNVVAHRYRNGEVVYKIVDFGIGTQRTKMDGTTRERRPVMGTLAYAAPEQLTGDQVDARADIYSLGVVAFELLTGRVPFAATDVNALLARLLFAAPPPPSSLNPSLARHVDDAVLKALDKEPRRRWQTATEFIRALEGTRSVGAEAVHLRPGSPLHERYELNERIGTGRLGSELYAGTHRAIGTPVVVRVLRRRAHPAWDTWRNRFLREARAMQVTHPSILQVRDFGDEQDLVYVVTDRVGGSSLRELLDAGGRLPWPRAHGFVLEILGGALAVHRRGGLIFGLTPSIVRVYNDGGRERLVMSSAGIAEVHDVLAGANPDTLGALEIPSSDLLYVAPEVLLGEPADGRTDIYTVAVIAYEMLTGHPPVAAVTVPQLVARIFSSEFTDIRELAPDVPARAADLIARCLAPRPDRRVADLTELESTWQALTP